MPRTASPFRESGSILLISTYESGHQPLGLAEPAGALARAGFVPVLLDLSQESLEPAAVARAQFVAISTPMHTALVIGARTAETIRALNPAAHVCFHGLYAALNAGYLLERLADSIVTGDAETILPAWVTALGGRTAEPTPGVSLRGRAQNLPLTRPKGGLPHREGLPPLDRYVKLQTDGTTQVVGYVEATKGCKHLCLHCPIPPVFQGRFFALPVASVMADIRQQVAAGARHITFGDPDFLNGPGQAKAMVRALNAEFPGVGYDFTAKIEHLLLHRELLPEFARGGCRFIVSAVESLSEEVLRDLDKGHTRHDIDEALRLCRAARIPLRPSLVPFTPWSTLADYLELLDWVEREGLIRHIEPIQLAIRLLVPPSSALLGTPQFEPHRRTLDAKAFAWRWAHPDPAMDALQVVVMRIVEKAAADAASPEVTFGRIRAAAREAAGIAVAPWIIPPPPALAVPRLTEPWFC